MESCDFREDDFIKRDSKEALNEIDHLVKESFKNRRRRYGVIC
jgi:hypothetical protein